MSDSVLEPGSGQFGGIAGVFDWVNWGDILVRCNRRLWCNLL